VNRQTVGGTRLYPESNWVDRTMALRLWTDISSWFSNEVGKNGRICVGQSPDLAALDCDYFSCSEDEIRDITSMFAVVGVTIVLGAYEFAENAPALPHAMSDWAHRNVSGAISYVSEIPRNMHRSAPLTGIATCMATRK
jgi:hypothetical protein